VNGTALTSAQLAVIDGIDGELSGAAEKLETFSTELSTGAAVSRGKAIRIGRGLREVVKTIDAVADRLDLLL
jgi:hypothetical protein